MQTEICPARSFLKQVACNTMFEGYAFTSNLATLTGKNRKVYVIYIIKKLK